MLERPQFGEEPLSQLGRAGDELLVLQHLQRGPRHCAAEWIAAEGAAVGAGFESPENLRPRDHRRHRVVAARQRLAEHVHVGGDLLVIAGEHPSGATEAGLDFVGDQQDALFPAKSGELAQKTIRRQNHPGLALDRLRQHGAGVGGHRLAHGVDVSIRHQHEAWGERPELRAVGWLGTEADDGGGAAVEVVVEGDDGRLVVGDPLDPVAPASGCLDCRLHRLGAGVHRQGHRHAA